MEKGPAEEGLPSEEELRQHLTELGFEFRPLNLKRWTIYDSGERSQAVPSGKPGAPIVRAARTLRAIRRGEIALPDGLVTQRARELAAKSEAARAATE